jgi:hypothetical protein
VCHNGDLCQEIRDHHKLNIVIVRFLKNGFDESFADVEGVLVDTDFLGFLELAIER